MRLFELWFSQGVCPVVRLLGHMVALFLVFKGISMLFSIVTVSIYILTNRNLHNFKGKIFRKFLERTFFYTFAIHQSYIPLFNKSSTLFLAM